jgi:hypothetical protein
MGFLDNSGDIILDVVLTDHGRKVLAKGDGSFQITKFALSDEEIDYGLYDKNNPSGSAYYDLEILQTPVLEAFTNNASSMKTRLMTFDNLELLFLPVMRLNERDKKNARDENLNSFVVPVNSETEDNDASTSVFTGVGRTSDKQIRQGFLFGETLIGTIIRIDQGLDTTEISPTRNLDPELLETSYTVQIDNRLGNIVDINGTVLEPDYIDDDQIAYYTMDVGDVGVTQNTETRNNDSQVIRGPRGSILEFRIQASLDLNTSNYLFTTLGGTAVMDNRDPSGTGTSNVYFIDTNIRVAGVQTGAFIDVPVRYVRLQ